MRVRLTYNTTPTPCGSNTYNGVAYGEVEDYTVNVMDEGSEWLTLNGGSGLSSSINPGAGEDNITVGFDSSELAGGIYNANILVTSNDPDDAEVIIPVTLTVESAPDVPANIQLEVSEAGCTT